jgi:hypothetical protein
MYKNTSELRADELGIKQDFQSFAANISVKLVPITKDDCSEKGLDLAGNLRIFNFAPPRLGHLAPASEVAGRHTLPF